MLSRWQQHRRRLCRTKVRCGELAPAPPPPPTPPNTPNPRELTLPIAAYLGIPKENVFANRMVGGVGGRGGAWRLAIAISCPC